MYLLSSDFRAIASSFFWLYFFWLYFISSAFHHCFSTLHIVGSLLFKLPSIIVYIQVYQAGMILYVDFDDRVRRFFNSPSSTSKFCRHWNPRLFFPQYCLVADANHDLWLPPLNASVKSSTWVHFRVIPHPRNSELLNKGISSKYLGTDQNPFFSLWIFTPVSDTLDLPLTQ